MGLFGGEFVWDVSRFAISNIGIQKRPEGLPNVRKSAFRQIRHAFPNQFRTFFRLLVERGSGPGIAYEKEIRPVSVRVAVAHDVRREQTSGNDTRFFEEFPSGSLRERFARFEPSGGNRPIPVGPTGIRPSEHQNLAILPIEQEYVQSNDDFRGHWNRLGNFHAIVRAMVGLEKKKYEKIPGKDIVVGNVPSSVAMVRMPV